MLTMFLSAAASSQFMLSLLSLMPVGSSGRRAFETVEEEYVKRYAVNGVMGVAVGASILGMGMAVAGTCPGTVGRRA